MRLVQDLESRLCTANTQLDKLRSDHQLAHASLQHAVAENCRLRAIVRHLFQTHVVNPEIAGFEGMVHARGGHQGTGQLAGPMQGDEVFPVSQTLA